MRMVCIKALAGLAAAGTLVVLGAGVCVLCGGVEGAVVFPFPCAPNNELF